MLTNPSNLVGRVRVKCVNDEKRENFLKWACNQEQFLFDKDCSNLLVV
jgi:hypothetical protein